MHGLIRFFIPLLLVLGLAGPGTAHPHIFIDARVVIVFDETGQMTGLRQAWTFDALYSAWAVQGLDENGDGTVTSDELQPLADDNMSGLEEFNYYSVVGLNGGQNVPFKTGYDAHAKQIQIIDW